MLAQHLVWWQSRAGAKGAAPSRAPTRLGLDPSPHTGNETLVQPTKCTNIQLKCCLPATLAEPSLPQFLISLKECNLSWSQSKDSAVA